MLWTIIACTAPMEPAPGPASPSVLLVTIDTWRADHLSEELAPNAWAVGERGLRFTRARSPIGLTTAAHATMMTGDLPPDHGLRGNNHHGYTLPLEATTIAEELAAAGFATAAFVSAYPAGPNGGLDQGFGSFSAPEAGERRGEVAIGEATAWIGSQEGSWFAWVHLYDPHGPYAPAGWGGGTEAEGYAAEVRHADSIAGPLYDLALERGASLIITSDHGEVHHEEPCGWQHERSSGDEVLNIPLVVAGPSVERRLSDALVDLTDIHGTILDLADLPRGEHTTLLNPRLRTAVLGESGLCDPECAAGCAPAGFLGKDRVAWTPQGSLVDRPGVGVIGDPGLAHHLEAYGMPVAEPTASVGAEEAVRSLGYLE